LSAVIEGTDSFLLSLGLELKILLYLYQFWYKLKLEVMAVLEVTSRQFRDNQKTFFELADRGESVIIKRGQKQAYVLTPIDDDDLYFTPEMLAKIDKSIQQAKEGKARKLTPELQKELLGL
jgi:hypothetical protein